MKKQTAIEWLVNEIPNIDWENSYWRNKIKKAKEMEKQQIEDAYEEGYFDEKSAEQYYKDTFKN